MNRRGFFGSLAGLAGLSTVWLVPTFLRRPKVHKPVMVGLFDEGGKLLAKKEFSRLQLTNGDELVVNWTIKFD